LPEPTSPGPSPTSIDRVEIEQTLAAARERLLALRVAAGHWEGELSSSALSTATAVCALEIVRRNQGAGRSDILERLVQGGLRWLLDHPNEDGGFGDAAGCPSNLSTTALAWAAIGMFQEEEPLASDDPFSRAEAWLKNEVGELTAPALAEAIGRRYGTDRTFSVPILTMCALAGRFGEGREAWRFIPRLPFELAGLVPEAGRTTRRTARYCSPPQRPTAPRPPSALRSPSRSPGS